MSEPIRFYLDEHIPRAIAEGIRRRGGDVRTVQEAGLRGQSDETQLDFARSTRRTVVTQDTDFLKLHAAGHAHAGIIFIGAQLSVGDAIRGIILIHELLTPGDMRDHIEFL